MRWLFRSAVILMVIALSMGHFSFTSDAGSAPPSRAPPEKSGTISGFEVWDEDVIVNYVTIASGGRVTIKASVTVYMVPDCVFTVSGELIVQGIAGGEVTFMSSTVGQEWKSIEVNPTGRIDIQNATFMNTVDSYTPIVQNGYPSVLKNIRLEGGWQGIWLDGSGGDVLENIEVHDTMEHSFVLVNSHFPNVFRNITVRNAGKGGMTLETSAGCEVDGFKAFDCREIYVKTYTNLGASLKLRDFSFSNPTFEKVETGILISYGENTEIFDGTITDSEIAIRIDGTGGNVDCERVEFTNVDIGVKLGDNAKTNMRFLDCDIDANYQAGIMNGSTSPQRIEFINTTWSPSSGSTIEGDAYLNVSWYVDVRIKDGIGNPLDSRFSYREKVSGAFNHIYDAMGRFDKVLLKDRTISGDEDVVVFLHDLQFRPKDDPDQFVWMNDYSVSEYKLLDVWINLAPYNDLPTYIEAQEDDWLDIDLDAHFTDPEGLNLIYTIDQSPDLQVIRIGGPDSGQIRIMNKQPDWYGTGWLNVNATDPGGKTTSANATLVVLPVNDAPVFTQELPEITIEEDTSTYFNFTGFVYDVEGDPIVISFSEVQNCTLDYDEANMNLSIVPDQDIFGLIEILVNISDGMAWSHGILIINVTPVNDPPVIDSVLKDGIPAPLVAHEKPSGEELMAYEVSLEEDGSVHIRIDAYDIDSDILNCYFEADDLLHGTIETIEDGFSFIYTPHPNDHEGDLVRFEVNDGEDSTTIWVWFNVSSVNDPIEFDPPSPWKITVEIGKAHVIDIGPWIFDADGDVPSVTTTSAHITVEGTVLTLLYDVSFQGDEESVTVAVSDGETEATGVLEITIDRSGDVEPTLGKLKVTDEGDSWVVTVDGSAGQDLWVVVKDKDGMTRSYKMTYENGKYSATIPKDEVEPGSELWISATDGGNPIKQDLRGNLASEKGDTNWLIACACCSLLGLGSMLLLIIVILLLKGRKKVSKKEHAEE